MWCIFLEICLSKLKVQQLEKEEKQDEISTEKEKDFKAPWSHEGPQMDIWDLWLIDMQAGKSLECQTSF